MSSGERFFALEQERDSLRLEVEECTALNDKLADLLRGVALALKGEPGPLSRHSFHDLPELVAALKLAHKKLQADCDDLLADRGPRRSS